MYSSDKHIFSLKQVAFSISSSDEKIEVEKNWNLLPLTCLSDIKDSLDFEDFQNKLFSLCIAHEVARSNIGLDILHN